MSLSIGELVGYVDLDTSGVDAGLADAEGKLEGAKGSWGKILGGIGIAAGGAFAVGLGSAMSGEAGADKLAASLGGTSKMADRLGRVAGDVYSNGFGAGLEDVHTAMGAVVTSIKGMRKASDAEVQTMTEKALTYADVMGIDVTRAAQVAGNMVTNGLAKNGSEAFDLLMKASQKVPTQLREDVLDATDEYGQFFHQLGFDGPAAFDVLTKSAGKGMYGIDKAGDAVKEFTIRSTDMSASTKGAYKAIGLDAGRMANLILAGGDAAKAGTGAVIDGLLKIKDPAKQANTAIALFGTPLEDLSTKDIPKFLKSLQGSEAGLGKWRGSVDKAGETAYDNASTNLSMFGRGLKTNVVELIGGKVLPKLTEWSGLMADKLGPTIDKVTGFLSKHKAVLGPLAVGIGAMVAVATVAIGVTKAWRAAQAVLNIVMAANPIGLLVLAIVGLVVGLVYAYKKSETFRKVVTKVFDAVKNAAKSVGKFFTKTLPAFFTKAWDKAKSTTSDGVAKVVGWVKGIPGKVAGGLSSLWRAVTSPFRSAFGAAKRLVMDQVDDVVGLVKGIPGRIANLGGRFADAGKALLQRFIDGMKNAAGIISGIAGNVWDTVKGLLNGAIARINAALEFTIELPGPNLSVNLPDIPQLATGGRATSAQLAVIGEGREPESVLPDSVLRGLLERAHAAGAASSKGDGGRSAPLIGQVVQAPGESAEVLAERLWFKTRTRG